MIGTFLYYFSVAYNAVFEWNNAFLKYISAISERAGQAYQVFKDNDKVWILPGFAPGSSIKCIRRADISPVYFPSIDGFLYDSDSEKFYEVNSRITRTSINIDGKRLPYIGGEVRVYGKDGETNSENDITDWITRQRVYSLEGKMPSLEQILIAWAINANRIGVLMYKVKFIGIDSMGDDQVYSWI